MNLENPFASEDTQAQQQNNSQVEEYTPEVKEFFGLAFSSVEHYANMLIEEGELRGLIGPLEKSRIWSRHIVNCAAIAEFLPKSGSVADIGSGAGLPGIVIALMRPDLQVHLIETMQKRCVWLQDCVDELDIDNVVIHNCRAEQLHKKLSFDCVTARAVASTDKMARWASPLIKSGGKLVLLKGDRASSELEDAKYVLKKMKLENPRIHKVKSVMYGEETTVVQMQKR